MHSYINSIMDLLEGDTPRQKHDFLVELLKPKVPVLSKYNGGVSSIEMVYTDPNFTDEDYLKSLGWGLVKQYDYDQFHTNRYKLNCMEIEFTYEGEKLVTCDLTIAELNCMPITSEKFKAVTELLGGWPQ